MRRIGFVVYPEFSVMALAVVSAFETVNVFADEPAYELCFVSEQGGPIKTSSGLTLFTEPIVNQVFDTLIIGGSNNPGNLSDELLTSLRKLALTARRIAATCTGAYALAETGLLDGRRVTTHWHHARDLQSKFPKINVDEDKIYINDGQIWTSAGMTAGLDLALALIEDDLGTDTAKKVARKLVVYQRRAGGQSQFSTLLELEPKSDRIQNALSYAKENLHKQLSVESLASAANLSPRQFSRAFKAETGQSPAKAIENLRIEAARNMTEDSRHPLDVIARLVGFSDPDRMRRAFLRAFGQPPQVIRRNAKQEA